MLKQIDTKLDFLKKQYDDTKLENVKLGIFTNQIAYEDCKAMLEEVINNIGDLMAIEVHEHDIGWNSALEHAIKLLKGEQ